MRVYLQEILFCVWTCLLSVYIQTVHYMILVLQMYVIVYKRFCAEPGSVLRCTEVLSLQGFFRFVSKQICLFVFGLETSKKQKSFFRFYQPNQQTTVSDRVSVCLGLNRKYLLFLSRTPLSQGLKNQPVVYSTMSIPKENL
jgi:hypothetical protein